MGFIIKKALFVYCYIFVFLSTGLAAQSAPDFSAARILVEARDTAAQRATHIATCNSIDCRDNDVESAIAAESFCDAPPLQVEGAQGSCPAPSSTFGQAPPPLGDSAAFGCARFAIDRLSNPWQMDDPQKLCILRQCAGDQPCFAGHSKTAEAPSLWNQGATLELPSSAPVVLSSGSDFHLWSVIRAKPSDERACLVGSALYHACVEPDGSLYLRLNSWSTQLSPPSTVPFGAWVSVEISRVAGELHVWVDGVEVTSGAPFNDSAPFVVGYLMSSFKGAWAFTGEMAGLWLYERELQETERQELYSYLAETYEVGPMASTSRITLDSQPEKYVVQRTLVDGVWTGGLAISGTVENAEGTGSPIEARVLDVENNAPMTTWQTVTTAGEGSWSGTLTGIPQGGWYRVEARLGDSPNASAISGSRFGVGAVIAAIGQSNMVKLFTEDEADGSLPAPFETPHDLSWRYGYGEPEGFTYSRPRSADIPVSWGPVTGTGGIRLANNLVQELGIPVLVLDFSIDWTGLLQHWNRPDTFSGWSPFASGLDLVTGLEAVVWHQGAYDAHEPSAYENDVVTVDEHKAGLDALYAQITSIRPESVAGRPLPMLVAVQNRGVYDDVLFKDDAYNAVRKAQIEWVEQRSHGFSAGSTLDLDISSRAGTGSGHFWASGYQDLGDRYSRAILSAIEEPGWAAGVTGGRITDATLHGRRIQLTVSHDEGSRLRLRDPEAPVEGFTVTDGEWTVDSGSGLERNELALESATLSDVHQGNVVQLVLAEEPTGPVRIRYLYGQNVFHDQPGVEARANGNTLYDDFSYFAGRSGLPILPSTDDLSAVTVAGLELDRETLSVPEGGLASVQVRLTEPVTQTVVVSLSMHGDEDLQLDGPSSLVFTPESSSQAQTVTVRSITDPDSDSDSAALRLRAEGYESQAVTIFELDGDPYLDVSADYLTVVELGGEASFDVTLGVPVSSGVRIRAESSDGSRLSVTPATLDFAAEEWSTPQTVTVRGAVGGSALASVDVILAIDAPNSDDAYDHLEDVVLPVNLLGLDSGLLLHWPLDETHTEENGPSWTPDLSGFDRHGEVGERARLARIGVEDGGIGSSGPGRSQGDESDSVLTPAFATGAGGDALSVVLWYGLDGDRHDGYLFHWGGTYRATDALSAYLDIGTGIRVRVHDEDDSTSVVQVSPPGFDQTGWHQLAVVKDSNGSRIFFDGEMVYSSAMGAGSLLPTKGFALGMNEKGTFGSIADFDEVRLYNRAIADEEIEALYTQVADSTVTVTLGPAGSPATDGRWALVDGSTSPVWHGSGETIELAPGLWTLRFDDVSGWMTPENREILVTLGAPLEINENYSQAGQGHVEVYLTPSEAATSGEWRLDHAPSTAYSSGDRVTLGIGTYTVSFSDLAGFMTPDPMTFEVSENETTVVSASYSDLSALDPILHLRLDESSGNVATDSSAYGNHGFYGSQVQLNLFGQMDGAARTTSPGGSSGNIARGIGVPALAGGSYTSATVAFWYRITDPHDGYLFHWGGSYNDRSSISIYLDQGRELRVRVHDSADKSSVDRVSPPGFDDFDGTWHHLAVTKSPSGTEVYFDGVHQSHHGMGAGSFNPSVGAGLGLNENGNYGTDAAFDELKVWARALGAEEIAALYTPSSEAQITVFLGPGAVTEAASWHFAQDEPGIRRADGGLVTVPVGEHTIVFDPVPGWETPTARTVNVVGGQALTVTGTYENTTLPGFGLLAHLPLDEPSGSSAVDFSGQERHGQIGSRMSRDLLGVDGRGMQTAGPGVGSGSRQDGLEIPFELGEPQQELTVSLWYRLSAEPHDGYLFNWGGSHTDDHAISAYLDVGTEIRVRSRVGGDHNSVISVVAEGFDDAGWHHFVVSKDGQGTSVFFDGELVAQSQFGAGSIEPADGFCLGMNESGRSGIEATFDDIRLYNRAVDAEESAELFNEFVRPDGFGGAYRTVDELRQELEASAVAHSGIMELVDFGDSWAKTVGGVTTPDGDFLPGDDLLAARITRLDNAIVEPNRPVFILMACLHAREIGTPELAMRFLDELLDGYGVDPDITWLVDHHEIWILPMVNPDGHRMVELGALAEHGSRPWSWRKNVRPTASCEWPPNNGNTLGVDLNRNFPHEWGQLDGRAGSGDACDSHYRGAGGGSEPETQALMSLASALIPDQRPNLGIAAPVDATGVLIQLHSPLRTVAWPWANSSAPSEDIAGLAAIGNKLASINGYPAGQAFESIYPMSGTLDDWVHAELGAPALLIEVGEGLMPAFNRIDNVLWPENREALLYAAKIARTPYLTARGPDVIHAMADEGPGRVFTLTATADDQTNGGQVIDQVEIYVNDPPWTVGATPFEVLSASDGSFDSPLEAVSGSLDLGHLSDGRHTLFLRASDSSGALGPVSSLFVDLD